MSTQEFRESDGFRGCSCLLIFIDYLLLLALKNTSMFKKNEKQNPYLWTLTGMAPPLLLAGIQVSCFPGVSRALIFFVLTAPFIVALIWVNSAQQKNRNRIAELLDAKPPRDASAIMELLGGRTDAAASSIKSRYWAMYLTQMYLAGHGFGWLILIFTYFLKWGK